MINTLQINHKNTQRSFRITKLYASLVVNAGVTVRSDTLYLAEYVTHTLIGRVASTPAGTADINIKILYPHNLADSSGIILSLLSVTAGDTIYTSFGGRSTNYQGNIFYAIKLEFTNVVTGIEIQNLSLISQA